MDATGLSHLRQKNKAVENMKAKLLFALLVLFLVAQMIQAATITRPILKISAPKPGQDTTNQNLTINGTAEGLLAVTNVLYQFNGGGWNPVTTTNIWSNWVAQVTLVPGTNIIQAFARDIQGDSSTTNTVKVFFIKYAILMVATNSEVTVSPNYNNVPLQIGKNYTVTAKLKEGFSFEAWIRMTGTLTEIELTFLTEKPTVKFTMLPNMTLIPGYEQTDKNWVKITNAKSGTVTTNSTFTLTGTFKSRVPIEYGVYYISGSEINLQTTNNWTNWYAAVPLALGTNIIQIYAFDTNYESSDTNTINLIRQPALVTFPVSTGVNIRNLQAKMAFDGTNYLVVFQTFPPGQTNNPSAMGQFVSQAGGLIGSLLALNPGGSDDPPAVAFDGTNYLAAWADFSNTQSGVPVRGVFVRPDGEIGTPIQLSQSTNVDNFGTTVFGSGVYFLMWSDSRSNPDSIYGTIVSPSGAIVASDFEISSNGIANDAGQSAAAFDGTNFLAVWSSQEGSTSIKGQLIDPAGDLIGSPIIIYTNSAAAEEALPCVVFDGTKYLVLFNIGLTSKTATSFHVLGRFVTTAGEVMTNQIALTSDKGPQVVAGAGFDGSEYLVSWNQGLDPYKVTKTATINARLFDPNGHPIAPEFPVFKSNDGRIPLWAPVFFDGTNFILVSGSGKMTSASPNMEFTNGVISGALVSP